VKLKITQRRMYSAPTMVDAYARIVRLIVESTVAPLGIVNADNDLQNSAGFATCSMTFIVENQKISHKYDDIRSKTWNSTNIRKFDKEKGACRSIDGPEKGTSKERTASNFLPSSASFSAQENLS